MVISWWFNGYLIIVRWNWWGYLMGSLLNSYRKSPCSTGKSMYIIYEWSNFRFPLLCWITRRYHDIHRLNQKGALPIKNGDVWLVKGLVENISGHDFTRNYCRGCLHNFPLTLKLSTNSGKSRTNCMSTWLIWGHCLCKHILLDTSQEIEHTDVTWVYQLYVCIDILWGCGF
jgi:hypothetical protein